MSDGRRISRQEPWFANFLLTEARGYRSRAIRIIEAGRWPVGTIFDRNGDLLLPANIADASFVLMEPIMGANGTASDALVCQRDAEVNESYLLYGALDTEQVNHYLLTNSNIIVRAAVFPGLLQTIFAYNVIVQPPVGGTNDAQATLEYLEANKVALAGDQMTGPLLLPATVPNADPLTAVTKEYVDGLVTGVGHYLGTLDAAQNHVHYSAASGFTDGPLIPADQAGEGRYVVCTFPGTMPDDSEMPGVVFRPGDWALSDGIAWNHLDVGGVVLVASNVGVVPPVFGEDNVQAALTAAEAAVDERVLRIGDTMTGPLTIDEASGTQPNLVLTQPPGAGASELLHIQGNPRSNAARIEGNIEVVDGDINVLDGFVMAREGGYFTGEVEVTAAGAATGRARLLANADDAFLQLSGDEGAAIDMRASGQRQWVFGTTDAAGGDLDLLFGRWVNDAHQDIPLRLRHSDGLLLVHHAQSDRDWSLHKEGTGTGVTPAIRFFDDAGNIAWFYAARSSVTGGPSLLWRVEDADGAHTVMRTRPGTLTDEASHLEIMEEPTEPQDAATKAYVDRMVSGTFHFIGSLDASTGEVRYTIASGHPNGPLVPADQVNAGEYVICDVAGTMPAGSEMPGREFAIGDQALSDGAVWVYFPTGRPDLIARNVAVIPPIAGGSDVQASLTNLESSAALRVFRSGDAMTGPLSVLMPTADLHAATRLYVDQAANTKVARAGDTMTGGLAFGSQAQASPTDLTRHIALWGGATSAALGFGFSITSGTLNYCVSAAANMHDFYAGANLIARINNTEFAMQGTRDVRARQFITGTDGFGLEVNGAGRFYKPTGTGLMLRQSTGNQQPQIENNDGSNRRQILDANNGVRKAGDTMTGALIIQGSGLISKLNSSDTGRTTLSFGYSANDHFHLYRNSGGTALHIDRFSDTGVATNVLSINRANGAVNLLGGSMLTLTGPPTAALHAATKAYVDSRGIHPWTTGANYAVNEAVLYDNRVFQVTTAITNAPATPNFTTIKPLGYGQSDYWAGNADLANGLWIVGAWVHICTVPAYGAYRIAISDLHASNDTTVLFDIVTGWNSGTVVLAGASHQGTGTWSEARLSQTGNGQAGRLELRVAAISGTPNFKIQVGGETRGTVVNSVTIQKPLVAAAANLGGTQLAFLPDLRLASFATSHDMVMGDGRTLRFYHAAPTDVNDGKIGTRLFNPGLNIVGSATETTGADTGRQISIYGQVKMRQAGSFHSMGENHGFWLNADGGGGSLRYQNGYVYLQQGSNNTQPRIRNFDGTNERVILDTINGVPRSEFNPTPGAWETHATPSFTGVLYSRTRFVLGGTFVQFEFTGTATSGWNENQDKFLFTLPVNKRPPRQVYERCYQAAQPGMWIRIGTDGNVNSISPDRPAPTQNIFINFTYCVSPA